MSGAGAAVSLRGIDKRFGETTALADCSFEIGGGEFVSLLGPSGCGKTSLLKIIGGFLQPDSGEVTVGGREMLGLPPNKRPVNTVFQSYALFSHKTVAENVAFPLEVAKVAKEERAERVREALALVRLEGFEERGTGQLSGGQAQRVALARALVGRPQVLLLDEPLAALDLKLRKAMQEELRGIHDRLGTTFVYVTHDQEEALTMSDRIFLMNEGVLVQQGTPRTIYDAPSSAFASDFLGESNLIAAEVAALEAGAMTLAVAGSRLRAGAHAGAAVGERVLISLRPERISLAAATKQNRLPGVVRRSVFLGHAVRAFVELPNEAVVTAQVTRAEGDGLEPGQRVEIGWDEGDAVLIDAVGAEAHAA